MLFRLTNLLPLWPTLPITTHNIFRFFCQIRSGSTIPRLRSAVGRVPIRFHKKIGSLDEILKLPRNREDDQFVVEKIVALSSRDFDRLARNLLAPMPFLPFGDDRLQGLNDGAWHSPLAHGAEKNRGVLVDFPPCYGYAQYAAFAQDTRELDFQNIPVEECTLSAPKQPEQ